MEPIAAIVTALALGAAAGLKEVAGQAVRDAYSGLRAIIQRKYAKVPLVQLEENPESRSRRGVVEEELAAAGAEHDEELLRQAQKLIDAVQQHAPETAAAIGVSLEEVRGAALRIADVIASGPAVIVKKSEFSGDIDISGVRAGQQGETSSKKA